MQRHIKRLNVRKILYNSRLCGTKRKENSCSDGLSSTNTEKVVRKKQVHKSINDLFTEHPFHNKVDEDEDSYFFICTLI